MEGQGEVISTLSFTVIIHAGLRFTYRTRLSQLSVRELKGLVLFVWRAIV